MVVKSVDEQPSEARQPKTASRRVSESQTVDAASRRVHERPTASLCSAEVTRRDAASTVARYKTRTPLSTYFLDLLSNPTSTSILHRFKTRPPLSTYFLHLFSLVLLFAFAFALPAHAAPVATTAISAKAYEQSGLVAQWDAIENAGVGLHDDVAVNGWIDLVGGCTLTTNVTAGGSVTTLGNAIVLTNASFRAYDSGGAATAVGNALGAAKKTIEIAGRTDGLFLYRMWLTALKTKDDPSSAYQNRILLWYDSSSCINGGLCLYNQRYNTGLNFGTALGADFTHTLAFSSAVNFTQYANGVSKGTSKNDGATACTTTAAGLALSAGCYSTTPVRLSNTVYRAVRVYNRCLTALEIARNRAFDRMRFEGATSNETGYAWFDEKLKLRVAVPADFGEVLVNGVAPPSAEVWCDPGASVTLVPKADPGYRFVKWSSAAKDMTVADDGSIAFEVVEPVTLGATFVDSTRHGIADYVQDGLVAMFDGLHNIGLYKDHCATATTWKELTGLSSDATIANRNISGWKEGAYYRSGPSSPGYGVTGYVQYSVPQSFVDNFNARGAFTLEFLTHFIGFSAGYGPLFALGGKNTQNYLNLNLNASTLQYRGSSPFSNSSGITSAQTNTVAMIFDGEKRFIRYYNGKLKSSTTSYWVAMNGATTSSRTVGMFSAGAGEWGSSADAYAIRVYNRALTAKEAMMNKRTDDERYFGSNVTYVVEVSGDWGAPEPAKGVQRVASGSGFSVTGATVSVSATARMLLTGWTWSPDGDAAIAGSGTSAAVGVTTDGAFAWHWKKQYAFAASAGAGGSVSDVAAWQDEGASVTLTATPDAGYEFWGWSGDAGELADPLATTITVSADRARTITAHFGATGHVAATATFALTGQKGVYSWNDAATWGGALPGKGDDVVIEGTSSAIPDIVIDGPMPVFKSVTVRNATVIFTGWHNALRTTGDVILSTNGKMTHTNATTDVTAPQNRVWVVCENFTIQYSSSSVNVTGKGWPGVKGQIGVSPVATSANHGGPCGGTYGGLAGQGYAWTTIRPYGSVQHPRDLGAAGSTANSVIPGSGGGAVLIEARGQVYVGGGGILANAYDYYQNGYLGGGAGGSIEIDCETITGSGYLQANGSGGVAWGSSGSGGRIAVNCDAEKQDALGMTSLSFLVRPGSGWNEYCYGGNCCRSEHGTLYLAAKSLLNTTVNVSAQVYFPTPSFTAERLVIPNQRRLEFPQDGFQLSVAGDVTLNGASGLVLGGEHLWYYGNVATDYNVRRDTDAPRGLIRISGATPAKAVIGGNLTMAGSASEIVLYPTSSGAALDEQGRPAGAVLEVGRTLTMKSGAMLYPICCGTNGIGCAIRARDLDLQSGATITANQRGFYGGTGESFARLPGQTVLGYSGGAYVPNWTTAGASHAGLGGSVTSAKALYGDAQHPVLPGAGSNTPNADTGIGGTGGGLIHVEVARTAKINGALEALGMAASGNGHACASAGGAIYLKAKRLYVGASGRFRANGCNSKGDPYAGGGGRIALWRMFDVDGTALAAVDTTLPTSAVYTVAGGTGNAASKAGGAGTFHLGVLPQQGLQIIVK